MKSQCVFIVILLLIICFAMTENAQYISRQLDIKYEK